jgi:hypothetical protein
MKWTFKTSSGSKLQCEEGAVTSLSLFGTMTGLVLAGLAIDFSRMNTAMSAL